MVFSKNKTTDEPTNESTSKKTAFKKPVDFPDYRESKDRLDELTEQRRELQTTVTNLESRNQNSASS